MVGRTVVPLAAPVPDVQALLKEMDHFGIERTLFFHYAFDMEVKDKMNRLTREAAKASSRLAPCWVLATNPTGINEKLEDQVDRLLEAGMKAARFFPDEGPAAGPLAIQRYLLDAVFDRLNRHRIPLLIPADNLHTSQPGAYGFPDIDVICTAFPELPVILLEPHYSSQAQLLALMRRCRNVHFTIPLYGLFHQVENTVKMFGAGRLFFGTNLPHFDPSLGIGMIQYGDLSLREKDDIAGDNLRRLLENVR
jgi:predicted TIM-barrel fold metal-dependent hydrolase